MKDFLLVFCVFIFFLKCTVFCVYVKDDEPSTKPPLHVEELPWLSFFDRKSISDEFNTKVKGQTQRRNSDHVSHSTLCPPGETGQLPYPPDCKRFINCWKGRGSVQVCAPGTLFNPETLECDFPGKVKCEDSFEEFGNLPVPTGERYVRFPHQRPQIIHNPRIARTNQKEESKVDSVPAKPYPGRPPYFGPSHLLPPTRPGNQTQGREVRPQCALGATGLYPHPYDCSKFLKCWSGNTFIQNCGPGTFFNPLISACDHIRNVPCTHEENYQPTRPDTAVNSDEDLQVPEESVRYEQYQKVEPPVKATGGKKTIEVDSDSPNYDVDPSMNSSTPKTEIEDLEPPIVSQTQTNLNQRKPKVINTGGSKNQFEPAPYLTPPQFDVYGNIIGSNSNKEANLGVQPDQNGYLTNLKEKIQNPSNPYLINYPPQGPYSTLQPQSQISGSLDQTKNYFGYILGKKHSHPLHPVHTNQQKPLPSSQQHFVHPSHQHPVHPHAHHPHTGPPTWLVPPPFQSQFIPYYAPYHPFSSKPGSEIPQGFQNAHVMNIPYYPMYISQGDLCSKSGGQGSPKCELSTHGSHNHPTKHPHPSVGAPHHGLYPQHSGNPHFQSNFNQKGDLPSESQFQINLHPNKPDDSQYKPNSAHKNLNIPTTGNSKNIHQKQPAYNPQFPQSNYPKPQGNLIPYYPSGSSNNPQTNASHQENNSVPTSQYQPYLFYYYPVTSSLYPNYPASYYPNHYMTPNYPQTSSNNPNYPQTPSNNPSYPQTPSNNPNYPQTPSNNPNYPQTPSNNPNYPQTPSNNPNYPQTPSNNPNYPQTPSNNPNYPQTPSNNPNYPQTPSNNPNYPQTPSNNPNYPQTPSNNPNYPQTPSNNPNYPQTPSNNPNYPQTSKTDSEQGQNTVLDPFISKPNLEQKQPVYKPEPGAPVYHISNQHKPSISDKYDKNYITIPGLSINSQHQPNKEPTGHAAVPDQFNYTPSSTISPQHPSTHVTPNRKPDNVPEYQPIYQGSHQRPTGPVEVSDDNKAYINIPGLSLDTDTNNPQEEPGQTMISDPYKIKNYITKDNDNIHGTPYYPAYNPTVSSRPEYNSNILSTGPPTMETATFPPFPGNSPSASIKTGLESKVDPPKHYLLGKIDVRGGEEDTSDDAESITTTAQPVKKRGSEKVDETVIKPFYNQPDKYSEPKTSNKLTGSDNQKDEKPKKAIKKPYVKVKQTPPNGQIVRLRNGASHLDGYLEMKDSKSKWGLVCDQPEGWGIAEATVACRELGFIRGAELSWQGYPIKSDEDELRVAVNIIECNGTETSLSECKINHNSGDECDVGRNAVGLRCFDNLASHCQPGEILYNQHCYKLHGKNNPDDPWIKTEEASEACKKHGGKLVDITSQYENDFISEWLIKKHPDVTAVATGGIGISVLGRPMWLWEGTSDPMVYERWWNGWSGHETIPKGSINGPLCIILRKTFSCLDGNNEEPTNDEDTCSADYFFWDVEDCGELRTSVFICERPMDDIGCIVGNGEGYVGTANTTASGLPCLPWDHPKVVEGLARRGAAQERSSRLVGHNYCRNLGSPDRHPWCFVEGRRNSEYCAIPKCWDSGKE